MLIFVEHYQPEGGSFQLADYHRVFKLGQMFNILVKLPSYNLWLSICYSLCIVLEALLLV